MGECEKYPPKGLSLGLVIFKNFDSRKFLDANWTGIQNYWTVCKEHHLVV